MSSVVPPWPTGEIRTLMVLTRRCLGNDKRHVFVDSPTACAAKQAQVRFLPT
jgi:hypothetical protein